MHDTVWTCVGNEEYNGNALDEFSGDCFVSGIGHQILIDWDQVGQCSVDQGTHNID